MASYMYNPSQKITELLSKYLKFDPEQLEIGIWSGQLTLTNVDLREEAIYPLLNRLRTDSNEAKYEFNGDSADDARSRMQQDYEKPPLKFKLVSGRIGSLSMTIPWKRLVWGQGDVKLDIRNVVLVVSLEARFETEYKQSKESGTSGVDVSSKSTPDDGIAYEDKPNPDPLQICTSRGRKQRILREAEKRLSDNRAIAAWLLALQKKERLKKVSESLANPAASLKQQEGHLDGWLRSTTKDFFWRFLAGLQMNIENLKIVMIQDGTEIGLIMPSSKVLAGVQQNVLEGRRINPEDLTESLTSGSGVVLEHPPQSVVYEGEYDDGEHLDKDVKIVGVGFYVRKRSRQKNSNHYAIDVSTSEYVIRPVDIDFKFSLFFPYPTEKRLKRQKSSITTQAHELKQIEENSTVTNDYDGHTTDSSRIRRGKRDKRPLEDSNVSTVDTAEQTASTFANDGRNSPVRPKLANSYTAQNGKHARTIIDSDSLMRRGSVKIQRNASGGTIPFYDTMSLSGTSVSTPLLPLAQPDDIKSYFAMATQNAIRSNDLSPRFDARLSVGAVHMILSTRHYELINEFLAGGAKLRNGRPTLEIQTFLNKRRRKSDTGRRYSLESQYDESSSALTAVVDSENNKLELDSFGAEFTKSEVTRLWWFYVFGSTVWELRQRQKLRRIFQKTFLSFSWVKQRYRRKEYVNLYIKARLTSSSTGLHAWIEQPGDAELKLLEIEDDLCIEQILLYRSIARRVRVYGLAKMPTSIITIQEQNNRQIPKTLSDCSDVPCAEDAIDPEINRRESLLLDQKTYDKPEEGLNTFLFLVQESCEVAKKRTDKRNGDKLESYLRLQNRLNVNGRGNSVLGNDDLSHGFSATQTIRTTKTVGTSAMTSLMSTESTANAMLLSFSVTVAELELVITEDHPARYGSADKEDSGLKISHSFGSGDSTVVSELTADEISNREDMGADNSLHSADVDDEPIGASTDYLLFKLPERVILQLLIQTLNFSMLGRSGSSRNINFSIGQVAASGADGIKLLSLGNSLADEAPLNEIQVTRDNVRNPQGDASRGLISRHALALSWIDKTGLTFLQCDISRLQGCLHYPSLEKIIKATTLKSVQYPKALLTKTPKEEIRLYILQQNSQPMFTGLNCSIRILGCELGLPIVGDIAMDENGEQKTALSTGSVMKCGIVEMYSGSIVEGLRTSKTDWLQTESTDGSLKRRKSFQMKKTDTRHLRMLDIADLLDARASPLSYHWVLAITEVDFFVLDEKLNTQRSFFENPLDAEMLFTINMDAVVQSHQAKTEVIVEMSPLNLLISEERLVSLSRVIPHHFHRPSQHKEGATEVLPPRLEVLSRFFRYSVEFSVSMVRVSLLEREANVETTMASRRRSMEEIVREFLNVVARFDLVFPHEESLSAAMQICIDRLSGLGLSLTDAWEATNAIMLNFLEDMGEAQENEKDSQFQLEMLVPSEADEGTDVVSKTIGNSAKRTISEYLSRLQRVESDAELAIVLDMPNGLGVTLVDLFFDRYVCFGVPTLFVLNGRGIHLVRLNPPDSRPAAEDVDTPTNVLENVGISDTDEQSEGNSQAAALIFHCFLLDKCHNFGKGGLPLSVLGSDDASQEETEIRAREMLNDLVLGEVEFFCSYTDLLELVRSAERILSSLASFRLDPSIDQDKEEMTLSQVHQNYLIDCASLSLLFVADGLFPFARFTLKNLVVRNNSEEHGALQISSQSLELLNLTPEGELHPYILSDLAEEPCRPLTFSTHVSDDGLVIDIKLEAVRFMFLQQFIDELLQYFQSGNYGLSRLLKELKSENSENSEKSAGTKSHTIFNVLFLDSTILLPRSSKSCDMIALDLDMGSIIVNATHQSFTMPTASSFLSIPAFDSNDRATFRRTTVKLSGVRMYSSLPSQGTHLDEAEHPSFRFLYSLDGRPAKDKTVYRAIDSVEDLLPEQEVHPDEEICSRRWIELTMDKLSLLVIVDYAPHLRILVSDPVDDASSSFELDLRLSQFCLILSIWYSNMQELPVMFPYSSMKLMKGARSASFGKSIPEYGTEAFKSMLAHESEMTTEIGVILNKFCLRFTFDDDYNDFDSVKGISLCLEQAVAHVSNDIDGLTRIGIASSLASLLDESLVNPNVLTVGSMQRQTSSWSDRFFGIERDYQCIAGSLPQPFQLSTFMIPGCTVFNLGMDSPFITLSNFGTIFKFIDYVTLYSSNPKYGHPGFAASSQVESMKNRLRSMSQERKALPSKLSITDFRLWLVRPTLSIPCEANRIGPGLRISSESGIWYRYCTIGYISSQEIVAEQICLVFDDNLTELTKKDADTKTLIDGLSVGFRMDSNYEANHSDISLQIPFSATAACGISTQRLCVAPEILSPPTICVPFHQSERCLGPKVCEITCIVEVLPLVFASLSTLLGLNSTDQAFGNVQETDSRIQSMWTEKEAELRLATPQAASTSSIESNSEESTISLVASVNDIRVFTLDPVLGPHLPIAVLSIAHLSCTSSQFAPSTNLVDLMSGEAPPEDLQISVNGEFWADYFKLGFTRSWEPFIEAYKFSASYEKSRFRGSGLSVTSDTSFHVNVSSALLVIVDEFMNLPRRLNLESGTITSVSETDSGLVCNDNAVLNDKLSIPDTLSGCTLIHEIPASLKDTDRVAFSLCNQTGDRIRIFKSATFPTNDTPSITYLEHTYTTRLSFSPSMSIVKNLKLIEVPYPGLITADGVGHEKVPSHSVDVQLPGFLWLRGIHVDTFGRSFANITPRSSLLRHKINSDWRLSNVMKLLVEVGMKNGGRQVTIRSLITVVNKTTHDISIVLHPNPSHLPNTLPHDQTGEDERPRSFSTTMSDDVIVEPGRSLQIPTLLLETALSQHGINLGCMWMKPCFGGKNSDSLLSFLAENHELAQPLEVDYSSRPLPFSKLVVDSSTAFDQSSGQDVVQEKATSAVQLSCPVLKESGDRLAPFCYAIEIGRSPIVGSRDENRKQSKKQGLVHGPIAYTVAIHPPIVLANLLPEKGRFELMHAVRRTVLWFGDLEPGQQVSVHSVGLDAPVLLLLNLGFAKTPVGEGALVHHGSDPPAGARDNLSGLKSIGKAGKAVTKQIGKTLTAIGESSDQRGLHKLNKAQHGNFLDRQEQKVGEINNEVIGLENPDVPGTEVTDGKTYRVDFFFPHDVVDQTTVVDGLGQRLTLNIDNVRGGGAQRRISVFAPYWVVNCTEHPLRYRQEKSLTFVSGTVHSPERDGSLPLSGGRSQAKYDFIKDDFGPSGTPGYLWASRTVFSGTYGALATSPGRCDLPPDIVAKVIDKNLPLEALARLAFMFNFQDGSVLTSGSQKLSVQLGDGTGETKYESDWSKGFSIDSVGISQIVEMHCKDGRALEVSVLVSMAPGFLSGYTKVVRFLPRYILVNQLPYPVRIWQDSSVFRPVSADQTESLIAKKLNWRFRTEKEAKRRCLKKINQYEELWGRTVTLDERDAEQIMTGTNAHVSALYITTISPFEVVPFILPDTRGDRQIRIDPGEPINLSSSFAADIPGEHTLKYDRVIDLKLLPHVSTRASPQYEVRLPPNANNSFKGELGIWFETEWGSSRNLIVKGIKKDSYAYSDTDVHVGDELLSIDGILVSRMAFTEAMAMLRVRLAEASNAENPQSSWRKMRRPSIQFGKSRILSVKDDSERQLRKPLRLIFRTVEERLRRVRLKAANVGTAGSALTRSTPAQIRSTENLDHEERVEALADTFIKAELRPLHNSELSMCLVLRDKPLVPFLVQNKSIHCTIFYRQRGCYQHSWKSAKPGQSNEYAWDEPMKPKRLSLRVAVEQDMYLLENNQDHEVSDSSRVLRQSDADQRRKSRGLGHVEDEEDFVFSPSLNVRMEEIGFRDYLMIPFDNSIADKDRSQPNFLVVDVDVEGATRVLSVADASREEDEIRMLRHIELLEKRADEVDDVLSKLQSHSTSLNISGVIPRSYDHSETSSATEEDLMKDAGMLMADYSDGTSIHGCHQIVVEVLEAIGLNPESMINTCNPYAEVMLRAKDHRRQSFFRKSDSRNTYFVRKAVSPKWNNQAFVFDIPPKAASVTRGYSIQVIIRNYRSLRSHETLGRAQIDLQSVRDQEPLVGWFPLVGRTGRRELENQLSHWGRGSIKIRLQWIYTGPSLIKYYINLSESRLADLLERVRGVTLQLEKKRESDEKKKEEVDGFKAVRVYDLLSDKTRVGFRDGIKNNELNVIKKLIEPLTEKARRGNRHDKLFAEGSIDSPHLPTRKDIKERMIGVSPQKLLHKQTSLKSPSMRKLEEKISERRLLFNQLTPRKQISDFLTSFKSVRRNECRLPLESFKIWAPLQEIFNDGELEIKLSDNYITVYLRDESLTATSFENEKNSDCYHLVQRKLQLPPGAPSILRGNVKEYISEFVLARNSFERNARRSIRTVLNPGGWLTLRPITALNLTDNFTSMLVKVRFGSEVITSEPADAKVIPTWYKPAPSETAGVPKYMDSNIRAEDLLGDLSENNLHIYVAPQQTSGSIRISVIGERSHQQLNTRTELGVLHLPLGSAIAACIDCADDSSQGHELLNSNGSLAYVRWFPLMNPKETVPVVGDGGLSVRPKETEKPSDNMFNDYFAPCLQLALIWTPDIEQDIFFGEDHEEASVTASPIADQSAFTGQNGSTLSPLVKNYVNADIGRISFALIDSERASELLSFNAEDIDVRYWVTNAKTRIGVSVGWIQLDYQDDNVREPVILAPTPSDFLLPVVQILAVKDNIRSKTQVLTFDFIDVSIAEFDLTIEECLIFDLYNFFHVVKMRRKTNFPSTGNIDSNKHTGAVYELRSLIRDAESFDEPTQLTQIIDELKDDITKEKKVYIDQLFLGVVKVNLSYLKGKKISWDSTKQGRMDGKMDKVLSLGGGEYLMKQFTVTEEESDVFMAWCRHTSDDERRAEESEQNSNNIPALLATIIPTLSDAPVRLQGKALNHVFESPTEIFQSIREFYFKETLNQIYKIIGSLDFVGNPTMLVTSFMSGVRDLVRAPSSAFISAPTDATGLGLGVAQGTISLFSHSVSGFFGVLAKVSAASGQGLAVLSLDGDFADWHRDKVVLEALNLNREWKRRGVQSFWLMASRPFLDISVGVAAGVAGIVTSPIRGYQNGGTVGAVRGTVVGVIGVFAKPSVGILDAVTHFSSSVYDVAKSVNVLDRRLQPAHQLRLPYTFGMLTILEPVDTIAARSAYFLKLFPIREWRNIGSLPPSETIVHIEVLPNMGKDTYAIATSCRVVLIKVKKEISGILTPSLSWEVDLMEGSSVASRVSDHGHNGVALTLTVGKSSDDRISKSPRSQSINESTIMASRMSLAMTDEKLSSLRGDDFGYGTGRSIKGDLVEWFTILAEYQHRRQLTRLHNAISCIIGDFESVVRDPWIGRPGSLEGYTCFGMYYFDSEPIEEFSDEVRDTEWRSELEDLPWVSSEEFEEASPMTIDEQRQFISELRSRWSFDKVLESSKAQGGSDWLVHARARAVTVTRESLVSTPKSRNPQDEDLALTSTESNKNGIVRSILKKLARPGKSQSSLGVDWESNDSFIVTKMDSPSIRSGLDANSFASAYETEENLAKDFDAPKPLSRQDSLSWSTRGFQKRRNRRRFLKGNEQEDMILNIPLDSGDSFKTVESSDPDSKVFFSCNTTISRMESSSSQDDESAEPEYMINDSSHSVKTSILEKNSNDLASTFVNEDDELKSSPLIASAAKSPRSSNVRMDRIETVLERMLVLTSEQTLQQNSGFRNQPVAPRDIESLREELKGLREEIISYRRDNASTGISSQDFESLRNEISNLREQILKNAD